ncbi:hypothetical protein JTB14_006166 [Gonioctena quinquepunctata]|nr:hypothetical protein JTB14_006166 [Gonioctena quinquepunctata]
MRLVGVHPDGNNQPFLYYFSVASLVLVGCLVIMALFFEEGKLTMIEITRAANYIVLFLHAIVKLTNLFLKRSQLLDILDSMGTHFWKFEDVQDPEGRSSFVENSRSLIRKFYSYVVISGVSTFVFATGRLIIDRRRIGNNLPYESFIPLGVPFELLFIYESIVGCVLVISIFSMDMLVFTIISLTATQFDLLNKAVMNVFSGKSSPGQEDLMIRERIRKYHEHHFFLIADSTQESIRAFLYATTMFFELYICYCLPAQQLIDAVETLPTNIYCTDWYQYPQHAKDVLIFLGQSQLDVSISAGGFARIDVQTGYAAFKTMISYCAFLRTVGGSGD